MNRQKIKTLIVGAYPAELKGFVDLKRAPYQIINNIAYLAAGIGPVAASFGLTHFLKEFAPQNIVAIGTAGLIRPNLLKIGDVVCVKTVTVLGRSAKGLETYVPQSKTLTLKSPDFKTLKTAHVFAPQEISSGLDWKKTLPKKLEVEHLESYAYAYVAKKFRTPLTILLGLTNAIGPNAHKEWQKNEARLMKKIKGLMV